MYAVGIDVGASGAVALVKHDSCAVWDMPAVKITIDGALKTRVNVPSVLALLRLVANSDPAVTAVEDVGGAMNQSAHAAVIFGKAAGYAEAAAYAAGLAPIMVRPQCWKDWYRKQRYKIAKGSDSSREAKNDARRIAAELYPNQAQLFARVCDDGRAEAVLIARYALSTISTA